MTDPSLQILHGELEAQLLSVQGDLVNAEAELEKHQKDEMH